MTSSIIRTGVMVLVIGSLWLGSYLYVSAQTHEQQACYLMQVGVPGRSATCKNPGDGCYVQDDQCSGLLEGQQVAAESCKNFQEYEYHFCGSYESTTCNELGSTPCRSSEAWADSATCNGSVQGTVYNDGINCETIF
jgi:hypothetical protein